MLLKAFHALNCFFPCEFSGNTESRADFCIRLLTLGEMVVVQPSAGMFFFFFFLPQPPSFTRLYTFLSFLLASPGDLGSANLPVWTLITIHHGYNSECELHVQIDQIRKIQVCIFHIFQHSLFSNYTIPCSLTSVTNLIFPNKSLIEEKGFFSLPEFSAQTWLFTDCDHLLYPTVPCKYRTGCHLPFSAPSRMSNWLFFKAFDTYL